MINILFQTSTKRIESSYLFKGFITLGLRWEMCSVFPKHQRPGLLLQKIFPLYFLMLSLRPSVCCIVPPSAHKFWLNGCHCLRLPAIQSIWVTFIWGHRTRGEDHKNQGHISPFPHLSLAPRPSLSATFFGVSAADDGTLGDICSRNILAPSNENVHNRQRHVLNVE